jgi:hypothetical protein
MKKLINKLLIVATLLTLFNINAFSASAVGEPVEYPVISYSTNNENTVFDVPVDINNHNFFDAMARNNTSANYIGMHAKYSTVGAPTSEVSVAIRTRIKYIDAVYTVSQTVEVGTTVVYENLRAPTDGSGGSAIDWTYMKVNVENGEMNFYLDDDSVPVYTIMDIDSHYFSHIQYLTSNDALRMENVHFGDPNGEILSYDPIMAEPIETKYMGDGGKVLIDYVTYDLNFLPINNDVTITTEPAIDQSRISFSIEDLGVDENGRYNGKINYEVDFPSYGTEYIFNVYVTNPTSLKDSNTVSYRVLTNDGEAEPTNTAFAYQSLQSVNNPGGDGYVHLYFTYIVDQTLKPDKVNTSDFMVDIDLVNYSVSDFYVSDNGNGQDWIGHIEFTFIPKDSDYTFSFMNIQENVLINYDSPSEDIVVYPDMDEYGQYKKADTSNSKDYIIGWHIPWQRDIYYTNMRGNVQIWFEYSFFREWQEAYFSELLSNIWISPSVHYKVIKHESYSGGKTVGNLAGRVLLEFRPYEINREYTITLKRWNESWVGDDGYRYEYPKKFRIAKLNRDNEENPFEWHVQDPDDPNNDYSVDLGSGKASQYIGTTINSSFGAFGDVFGVFKDSLGPYTIPALFIIIILLFVPSNNRKKS